MFTLIFSWILILLLFFYMFKKYDNVFNIMFITPSKLLTIGLTLIIILIVIITLSLLLLKLFLLLIFLLFYQNDINL